MDGAKAAPGSRPARRALDVTEHARVDTAALPEGHSLASPGVRLFGPWLISASHELAACTATRP